MKNIDKRIFATVIVLIMVFCFPQSTFKDYLGMGIQVSAADGRLYDQRSTEWVNVIHGTGHLSGPGVYDSGYSTGCGIFSFCNAIYALNDIKLDPVSVADWAHSIGAYNKNGAEGTYREVFYNNVESTYSRDLKISMDGFFSISNINDSRLTNHLNSGGVAIGYVPGHFIAITGYDNISSKFKIIDSFVTNSRNLPACGWVSSSTLNGANSQSKVSWVALLSKHYENINPTYAKLSVQDNRTEFLTGEEVNFRMESDGTAHYIIGIDRNGQRILTADVGTYNSEYNYALTEPGSYSVYVSNYYMDGTNHVESNVVEFNVLPRLLAPNVSVQVNGKKVRLSWDPVQFATHYDVRVYYEDGTHYEDYWGGIPAETYIDLELPINRKFYAQVCSSNVDYGNFTYCDPVYFETGLNAPELKAPDVKVSVKGRKVRLSWDPVENATHYDVRLYYADGTSYADYWGGEPAETFKELVLPADTEFRVIVCSANKDYGNFTYCEPVYFTTANDVTASVNGTYTYSGTPIIPKLTVKSGSIILKEGSDYNITATNNKKAGTAKYTVKAVSGGKYNFEDITGTFTIEKKRLTVSAGTYEITKKYDGTTSPGKGSGTLSVSGVVSGDTVTVTPGTIPSYLNAGVHYESLLLPISITNTNYVLSSPTVSVYAYITAVAPTVKVMGTYTYTGKAIIPNVTVTIIGKTLVKGTDYTITATNNVNAGTATYTVKSVTGSDYAFADVTGTFTINKAKSSVAAKPAAIYGLKYDGKAKALVTAGIGQNGTMVYSLDGKIYSSNIPTAKQAGTYTVFYKVQGSGNYTDSAVYRLTVEIANGEERIKSISVSNKNILVIYGYVGSDESSRSERVDFADVTIDMVEWMHVNDPSCGLLSDFVTAFSSSSQDIVLTKSQLQAIEYVLAYDYSNA